MCQYLHKGSGSHSSDYLFISHQAGQWVCVSAHQGVIGRDSYPVTVNAGPMLLQDGLNAEKFCCLCESNSPLVKLVVILKQPQFQNSSFRFIASF